MPCDRPAETARKGRRAVVQISAKKIDYYLLRYVYMHGWGRLCIPCDQGIDDVLSCQMRVYAYFIWILHIRSCRSGGVKTGRMVLISVIMGVQAAWSLSEKSFSRSVSCILCMIHSAKCYLTSCRNPFSETLW